HHPPTPDLYTLSHTTLFRSDLQLGRARLGRADDADARDLVRLPVGGSAQAHTLVGCGDRPAEERGLRKPGAAPRRTFRMRRVFRSEEHTSELQSQSNLVCRL